MRWKWMTIAVAAASLALAPAAQAADYTVTGTIDDAGACDGTDCTSIRAALSAIKAAPDAPDTVTLRPGDYPLAGPLVLDTPVALRGGTARDTKIIAASGVRALEISANAAISHLTIAGGGASDFGGNVLAQRATVSLDQVRVTGGHAATGGGIANRSGTMTITNSLIDGNAADSGGGGIANVGDATSASLTVRNSTVTGNTAAQGGGIVTTGTAEDALALKNVTVAANHVGGGVYAPVGTFTVGSSLFAGNTQAPGGATSNCGRSRATSQGSNVETADQCLSAGGADRVNVGDARLAPALADLGGETDVLAPLLDSPALNVETPSGCQLADQRGVARPQGPACDAGAVELVYAVRIDSGPSGTTNETSPPFSFSSSTATATFQCALDVATFANCPTPYALNDLADGAHTLHVRAMVDDQPIGETQRAFTVDTVAPTVSITPPGPTSATSATVTFTASEPGVTYSCRVTAPQPAGDPQPETCTSPWTFSTPGEGNYIVEVSATDAGSNVGPYAHATVVVDRTAPAAVVPSAPAAGTFSFAGTETGGSFQCRLEGPSGDSGFGACTSPQAYPNLPAGNYAFTLRTLDAAGNHADAVRQTFSIAAPPGPTAEPVPAPAPTPAPVAVAPPIPQADKTVVIRPTSGKVFVRQPGSTRFVEVSRTSGIPLGSEIDTRKGKVVLTAEPVDGKPVERATFYAGLFVVRQAGTYVELTLSEELAPCKKKRKASAAAAKPKIRKLWGNGKGKFRTKGQYSSATVRGTQWLVQDSCEGTLTRVAQGVVSVRDVPKRKTVLVRAGRSYLAKPKR